MGYGTSYPNVKKISLINQTLNMHYKELGTGLTTVYLLSEIPYIEDLYIICNTVLNRSGGAGTVWAYLKKNGVEVASATANGGIDYIRYYEPVASGVNDYLFQVTASTGTTYAEGDLYMGLVYRGL